MSALKAILNYSPFAKISNPWLRRLFSWSSQLLVFLILLLAIDNFKSRDLLKNNQLAPNFLLPQLEPDKAVQTKLRPLVEKGKNSILFFWAPWCTICKLTIHNLNALKNQDTNVFAVALAYKNFDEINQVVTARKVDVPVLLGNSEVEEAYKIEGYPTTYFIDKTGKIYNKTVGYTSTLGLQFRAP